MEFGTASAHARRTVQENPEQGIIERQRLLACAIQMFGRENSETAIAMYNLAFAYRASGQLDQALEFFGQSLEFYEKRAGFNSLHAANALNAMGSALMKVGQFKSAEVRLKQALEVYRRLGNQDGVAMTLDNLGVLALSEKRFQDAVNYFQEVWSYRVRTAGERSWGTAIVEANMGTAYWNLSRAERNPSKKEEYLHKGEERIRAALATADQLNRSESPWWKGELSLVLTAEGRYRDAWDAGVDYLRYNEANFGHDTYFAGEAQANLAVICAYWKGCPEKPARLMDQGRRMIRRGAAMLVSGLSEREQLTLLSENTQETFEDALSLAVANPKDSELASRSA
ncbi:MAG TPA: tetratricopeptide repeat protein, partial [Candidatus Dormibacteraeota bacterium]|nr:tetratricopeptide repeat protein [Candidatus Dormibacteraeota bacterium]